jgi:hypothetical protein
VEDEGLSFATNYAAEYGRFREFIEKFPGLFEFDGETVTLTKLGAADKEFALSSDEKEASGAAAAEEQLQPGSTPPTAHSVASAAAGGGAGAGGAGAEGTAQSKQTEVPQTDGSSGPGALVSVARSAHANRLLHVVLQMLTVEKTMNISTVSSDFPLHSDLHVCCELRCGLMWWDCFDVCEQMGSRLMDFGILWSRDGTGLGTFSEFVASRPDLIKVEPPNATLLSTAKERAQRKPFLYVVQCLRAQGAQAIPISLVCCSLKFAARQLH